jgi:hypothetical protein
MLSLLINHEALQNEAWKVGMTEEPETTEMNNTWKLIKLHAKKAAKVKSVYKLKHNTDILTITMGLNWPIKKETKGHI